MPLADEHDRHRAGPLQHERVARGVVHAGAEHDRIEADARRQLPDCRAGRRARFDLHAPAPAPAGDHRTHRIVRIDEQHPPSGEIRRRHLRQVVRIDAATRTERELRATARLALHADRAAHVSDEALRDGQSQPGATVTARGRGIGLHEWCEQVRQSLGGNADAGIAHDDFQQHAARFALDALRADRDLAALGELHRVRDQVEQHLSQPGRIADEPARQPRVDVIGEFKAFAADALG